MMTNMLPQEPWINSIPTPLIGFSSSDSVEDASISDWDFVGTTPFETGDTTGTDIDLVPTAELLKSRLRRQWPVIQSRSSQAREQYPDAVQALRELFSGLSVDEERWREIIEEPYG